MACACWPDIIPQRHCCIGLKMTRERPRKRVKTANATAALDETEAAAPEKRRRDSLKEERRSSLGNANDGGRAGVTSKPSEAEIASKLRNSILNILAKRAPGKTCWPSEAARATLPQVWTCFRLPFTLHLRVWLGHLLLPSADLIFWRYVIKEILDRHVVNASTILPSAGIILSPYAINSWGNITFLLWSNRMPHSNKGRS